MKKVLLSLLLALPLLGVSQAKFTNLSFDEAMAQAQKENKIILVDIMRPGSLAKERELIEKEMVDTKEIADYLNKNVICVRMDMSSEAGKAFAPRLMMNMYPTYGFYHANGDLIKVKSPFTFAKDITTFLPFAGECVKAATEKKANSRQIVFEEISFEQALAKAKEQSKLIFIDAYTDNCQPCMMMAKNVFTLDKVADKYNENFINLKLNLGTVEVALAKKYGTTGYPAYLFINGDGELVYMNSGYTDADKFMGYADQALEKFNGIIFEKGTWAEAVAKSKATGKPIFVDCYTTWCGPCKMMANTVFKEADVAEYFNKTFINVKIDMEKGEGLELKKTFEVKAYPTFVFVTPNGEIVNRIVGSMSGPEFVEKAKTGLSEKGLLSMQKRYKAGERNEQFVLDYINTLGEAYLKDESTIVVNEFIKTVEPTRLVEPAIWALFVENVYDVDSPLFVQLSNNKQQFVDLYTDAVVNRKIYQVWSAGTRKFISKTGETATLDKKGFDTYVKRLKKAKVERSEEIIDQAKMFNAESLGNFNDYATITEKLVKHTKYPMTDMTLYNCALKVDRKCADRSVRDRFIVLCEGALAKIVKKEAEEAAKPAAPGTTKAMVMGVGAGGFKGAFEKVIAELKKDM